MGYPQEKELKQTPELEVFAREMRKAMSVELIETDDEQLLSIPEHGGRRVIDVREVTDKFLEQPRFHSGCSTHLTTESFLEHFGRFKSESESVIFAHPDPSSPRLTAIYDYHTIENPSFQRHRAMLILKPSKEWVLWAKAEAQTPMSQLDFAQLLEDRIEDVRDPSVSPEKVRALADVYGTVATPTDLLTLKDGLTIRADVRVTNIQRLSSGQAALSFEESHTDQAGNQLRVPGAFFIAIPVFEGGPAYLLAVRLRYRLNGGKVTWSIAIRDQQKAFDNAFQEVIEKVRAETKLPVFIGSP